MRTVAAAFACGSALIALAGSAWASPIVGVNDDAAKDADLAPWFYSTMQSTGLTLNALTVRWDDNAPADIPGRAAIAQAIAQAQAANVSVELDLYPLHSRAFTSGRACAPSSNPLACGDTSAIRQFAGWTASVAQAFPSVQQFVVMNECNQPLFINPQWNAAGQNQSAAICGRALAAAYDALKAVSPTYFVWGVGLSPRGNDLAKATSNSSTSPVKFLGALGAWFKAFAQKTGRKAPLMDGLDDHPYPIPQSLPFVQGYANPNEASVSNLPRLYQAFYDGFRGSPQKTIGQQPGGGLPVSLNETGIQTDSSGRSGSLDVEVSANAAGGVIGATATESYQAGWYRQMLNLVACDPNVQVVNIFHLIDETSLAGWQSGLYYADQTAKQSAQVVGAFTTRGGSCQGRRSSWKPTGLNVLTPPVAKPKIGPASVAITKVKPRPTTKTAKGKVRPKAKVRPKRQGKAATSPPSLSILRLLLGAETA